MHDFANKVEQSYKPLISEDDAVVLHKIAYISRLRSLEFTTTLEEFEQDIPEDEEWIEYDILHYLLMKLPLYDEIYRDSIEDKFMNFLNEKLDELAHADAEREKSATFHIDDVKSVDTKGVAMKDEGQLTRVQQLIVEECDRIKEMLLRKNRDYGNSALEPVRIFSSASPLEQINVRIDDKLSRIKSGGEKNFKEDTEMDLIGYLVLKQVARRLADEKGEGDLPF